MPRGELPKGVHRVRRETKAGVCWHFYAWRGGPKFWKDTVRSPKEPAFFQAFALAVERPKPAVYMTHHMVDDFLSSAEMPKAERTRLDYRKWALRFAEAFKDDPAALFEEPESRAEVNEWRRAWAHSPKQYDYAGTVVTRILNWAWKDAGKLRQHHCMAFKKVYKADRSDVVWKTSHREHVCAIAPIWVQRILTTACETGLRPGDLVSLAMSHVEQTTKGRRIRLRTNKRHRIATIPVTPEMGKILDETPSGQFLVLVNARGKPLTPHRASEGVRQWRDKAGLTPEVLGYELRLQDARGTAATRLLHAGLSLGEIAAHMGWSLRHAANVIESYALVSHEESDAVLEKLAALSRGRK